MGVLNWMPDPQAEVFFVCLFVCFGLCHMACGILVPRPGIEPGPSAVRVWSPNHWTAREVPRLRVFFLNIYLFIWLHRVLVVAGGLFSCSL